MTTRAVWSSRRCALALACLLLATESLSAQQVVPADLAWVPADAPGFFFLHVADLLKHETTKELREHLVKQKGELDKELEKNVGLGLQDIERVLLIVPPPGPESDPVFLLTTRKPARDKFLAAMLPQAVEKQHRGKSYHESPREGKSPWTLHAASDRLLVFGPAKHVLPLLERAGGKRADGPLSEGLQRAAGKAPLVVCFNLAAYTNELKNGLPPQVQIVLPLLDAQRAVVTVVSDLDTTIDLRLTFEKEEQATVRAKLLGTAVDILKQYIPIGRTELARGKPNDDTEKWLFGQGAILLDKLEEGLKAAKVQAQGREVRTQLHLKVGAGMGLTAVGALFLSRTVPPMEFPLDK